MSIKGNIKIVVPTRVVLTIEAHLNTRNLPNLKEFRNILVYKIVQLFNGKVLESQQGVALILTKN